MFSTRILYFIFKVVMFSCTAFLVLHLILNLKHSFKSIHLSSGSGISHTGDISNSVGLCHLKKKKKNLQPRSTADCKSVSVLRKMDRKDPKSAFFFQVFSSALSSFSSSSQRKKQASAHTRAVMWFQCLGPCGIVPSGGKPLRLCWHITTPIINSRSAPFISITSFFLSSFCTFLRLHLGSHRCPWLLHLYSPPTLFF